MIAFNKIGEMITSGNIERRTYCIDKTTNASASFRWRLAMQRKQKTKTLNTKHILHTRMLRSRNDKCNYARSTIRLAYARCHQCSRRRVTRIVNIRPGCFGRRFMAGNNSNIMPIHYSVCCDGEFAMCQRNADARPSRVW